MKFLKTAILFLLLGTCIDAASLRRREKEIVVGAQLDFQKTEAVKNGTYGEEARDALDTAPIVTEEVEAEDENLAVQEDEKGFISDVDWEESNILFDEEEALEASALDLDPALDEVVSTLEDEPLVYRKLMKDHNNMHMPLMCNNAVDWDSMTCSSFANLKSSVAANETLVVPCSKCVKVDITDGSTVNLPNGIRIEGKLYFPSSANVTLRTTFAWVLGMLKMDTPAEGNLVKISLFGDDLQTFKAGNNTLLCGHGCQMGSKAIGVFGGQLDIQGVEAECPSWEKLTAVGQGDLRPFTNHLPSANDVAWTSDRLELAGKCHFSDYHTRLLGKSTIWCPIKETGADIGTGSILPIKLTSVAAAPFEYPTDDSGNTLSLTIRSACGLARGHISHFKKCTMYCPVEPTADVRSGAGGPVVFTNTAPDSPRVYKLPSRNGVQPTLKIRSQCFNSEGHSKAWGRCTIGCPLLNTVRNGVGSPWDKLQLRSKYHPPVPFPHPKSKSEQLANFTLASECKYMERHSSNWNGCVVRCTLHPTSSDLGGYHGPAWLVNPKNGNKVVTRRILQWAHGGENMFILLEDVNRAECEANGANTINNIFDVGDAMEPSYRMVNDTSKEGSTMLIDKVLHFAYGGKSLYFLPSDKDNSTAACNAVADKFNDGFLPGYEILVDYAPGPKAGETFGVNGVHHWAHNGRTMYLFPENADGANCENTIAKFNTMFPIGYGINVTRPATKPFGQVVTASQGVHHWSWREKKLYFHPDESADSINAKFSDGYQLEVSFMDTVRDAYEVEVSSAAAGCWKPGTEVLLTSHTRSMKDQQVRTIESSDATTGIIRFTRPIERPISKADHPDFAIEIASLNRRIVFEASSDENDEFIGGHLVVHHTATKQHIEGVEIRNFGQQGRLGKYPLHFHMCGDSPESLVKKNVVRNSNQRCYVVHLTNNVTLEENVAYNNFGHCYFIEDGAETGNVFKKNLGSGVKVMPADRVAKLSASSGRKETDGGPNGNGASVFWISNSQNYFYGNVAAGGEKNGYWFQPSFRRRYLPLGAFENNEVHSSASFAFTVYGPGWRPNEVALIKNIKVYRNPFWGAFLHVTKNLHFEGGIFADNGDKAVMINRGDDLVFNNTIFIGKTNFTAPRCRRSEKVGISLNPHRLAETVRGNVDGSVKGMTAKNLQFLNWSPAATECNIKGGSMPLKFNYAQTFIKAMNAYHYFENIQVDDTASTVIDACMQGINTGIDDVSIEVASDTSSAFAGTPGFLVSPKVATMLSGCNASSHGCLNFCPGACLRTITVLGGDSAFSEDIVMKVSDGTREITIHRDITGGPSPNPVSNNVAAAYTVVLPKASYIARFESLSSPGSVVWPKYAAPVFEAAPFCGNYITQTDLSFVRPVAARTECNQLITNGNFDSGEWGIEGWNGFNNGKVKWLSTSGVGGSGALMTTLSSSANCWPNQEIDVTCLQEGDVYNIKLSYKIVNSEMKEIIQITDLPYVRAKVDIFDIGWQDVGWHTLALSTTTPTPGNWGVISGQWTVTAAQARADKLRLHVTGASDHLLIDDFSVTRQ